MTKWFLCDGVYMKRDWVQRIETRPAAGGAARVLLMGIDGMEGAFKFECDSVTEALALRNRIALDIDSEQHVIDLDQVCAAIAEHHRHDVK